MSDDIIGQSQKILVNLDTQLGEAGASRTQVVHAGRGPAPTILFHEVNALWSDNFSVVPAGAVTLVVATVPLHAAVQQVDAILEQSGPGT